MATPPSLDRYRVPILDRTLNLIELLAAHPEGLTLTAMTERLEMPKNSVFRIATTLMLRGYVVRDEAGKIYRLTSRLLATGQTATGSERLTAVAGPILSLLRDATGETALLGTLAGDLGVVLDQVPSSHPVKVVVEIGHSFPLHTAAPAKAILAFLPEIRREALIAGMTFPRFTERTIGSATEFRRALEEVRATGIALDDGEESTTYACAAAPVFGRRGDVVAALWISGPADRVTTAALPALGQKVRHHADLVSAGMGASLQGRSGAP
jgi:DNA-binding IclR family transcriptional regulator